tara:strand:- start:10793 stop:11473 length:681 start_codon:yes stop_codon:yes gene_type:complete
MPLVGSALSGAVFGKYVSTMPTATAAVRTNVLMGVPTHCVPQVMIECICNAFAAALLTVTVKDIVTGTAGAGTAAPVPFVFPPPAIAAAQTKFIANMAWAGPSAPILATALITDVATQAMAMGQVQMGPPPGVGVGTGVISPASNPHLAMVMSAAVSGQLNTFFTASKMFNLGDAPAGPLTPQIAMLIMNLSTAYGSIVGAVTGNVAYVGSASTSAAATTGTGKFI